MTGYVPEGTGQQQVELERPLGVSATQSCPTLWGPVDDTVHGILQARRLEWVAVPFPTLGSNLGQTWVSGIAGRFFTV